MGLIGNGGLFKATTAYTSACIDAGAALHVLLSGETRVHHWQYVRSLWPDTRMLQFPWMIPVDWCFHTMPYSMQQTEQIPNDPPRMGTKSTTNRNHHSTPACAQITSIFQRVIAAMHKILADIGMKQ